MVKTFILRNVLCDYTCGCIVVAARTRRKAVERIKLERDGELWGGGISLSEIDKHLEEIGEGYYSETMGGG